MSADLVSAKEAAEILEVSRQRLYRIIAERDDFPKPAAELAVGRLWRRLDVERWAVKHPRRAR